MRSSFTYAFVSLLVATNAAVGAPTKTQDYDDATDSGPLVPRSYASGGLRCYYSCPSTTTNGYQLNRAFSGFTGFAYICAYDIPNSGGTSYNCYYDQTTGANSGSLPNTGLCVQQAALAGCGATVPGGGQYFKKRTQQHGTKDDESIAKRQYSPKKNNL